MDGKDKTENLTNFNIYSDFLSFYQENYNENFIILIGDKDQYGHEFALELIKTSNISKICILKGGIDALRLEYPNLLRRGQQNHTEKDFILQYERFIKKSKTLK